MTLIVHYFRDRERESERGRGYDSVSLLIEHVVLSSHKHPTSTNSLKCLMRQLIFPKSTESVLSSESCCYESIRWNCNGSSTVFMGTAAFAHTNIRNI